MCAWDKSKPPTGGSPTSADIRANWEEIEARIGLKAAGVLYDLVRKELAETIAGIKTFSSIPVLPSANPTTENQASRKGYVDGFVKQGSAAGGHLTGTYPNPSISTTKVTSIRQSHLIPGSGAGGDLTGAYPSPTIGGLKVTGPKIATSAVSQAKLKSTTGTVSHIGTLPTNVTLPGGEYGFYPRIKVSSGFGEAVIGGTSSTSWITNIRLVHNVAEDTTYALQRYITASGKDHWIFLLCDKTAKQIIAGYEAPDHPCYGQGADETEIPHPFANYFNEPLPDNLEIILVDNFNLPELRKKRKRNYGILEAIHNEYEIDELSEPVYKPREVIEIDEWGDRPGKIIENLGEGRTLKRRAVQNLPSMISYRKLKKK